MVRLVAEWANFMLPPIAGTFGEPKYPFHNLEVGESVVIPWPDGPGGKGNGKVAVAVSKHARRTGKRFSFMANYISGLTVTRLA